MTTGFIWHESFAWHDAGRASQNPWSEPYPALDRPESKRRLYSLLAASGLMDKLTAIKPRPATDDELLRFHTAEYLTRVKTLSAHEGGDAGESARLGPGGFATASLAAGGCIEAVEAVVDGRVDNAYALVRPCGHHAEPDRGRGFCVFGNIAVTVRHALKARGLKRVAVIDWDVHHGNGTQAAFYDDPRVLTVSLHQDRCYPVDSGALEESGAGDGLGYNLNLPLPPGSGHGAYIAALGRVVLPALVAFRPDLIVVASGYDACASDPLGRMLCHSGTYREMTTLIMKAAADLCGGKLVVCHEGGYSPTYVPFCGLAVIETLSGEHTDVTDPLIGWYAAMGGQELQPHQAALLERALRQLEAVPLSARAA